MGVSSPPTAAHSDRYFEEARVLTSTTLESYADEQLMALLAGTADQATFNRLFTEIFNRYKERVGRWCYRVTKSRDRASDLAQEVFFKAFRNIHTFRGDSQVSTWLYVIARNHCLNDLRRARTRMEVGEVSCSAAVCSREEDAFSAIERTQSCERILVFLRSILDPIEVTVLSLHYLDELELPAITRRLMLPNASGAKAYLVSARRKLQKWSGTRGRHRGIPDKQVEA